ncbi:TPA: hypothetical protein ACXR0I_004212 [Klebsiella variicola subsp. variicola]|uniref:hypothetical protein n=1 Tax=Klebsiella quasipneumoniae TaxID=1463165 RepID=UPI00278B70F7|nr:hypothetical protein [Klebsiella quasipneumoniae]EIY5155788.1 hypothetical protein [Klebsiella variicola]HCB0675291.1 hypothetical protein [Klebsiella quasipneumoniae subsp. similipneumoniae]HCI6117397.1 hypothetical protein [Klebsiella quasipneumoniae subsp. similipneumoniae]HCI6455338.1 hypothetical protein [Klebsiella quasipneumoniae subsp. similipneumoniae]HCI6465872.1 hypothetical protein [Klebsiella quasipneumoniae subsp. similipneumoniae]
MKTTLEDLRASLLEAMSTAADPVELNKSAEEVLADAVQDYLSAPNAATSEPTPGRGRPGIAITHKLQGYSANNRPVSLLMKSGISIQINKATLDNAAPEIISAFKRLGYDVNQGGSEDLSGSAEEL